MPFLVSLVDGAFDQTFIDRSLATHFAILLIAKLASLVDMTELPVFSYPSILAIFLCARADRILVCFDDFGRFTESGVPFSFLGLMMEWTLNLRIVGEFAKRTDLDDLARDESLESLGEDEFKPESLSESVSNSELSVLIDLISCCMQKK